MNFTVAGTPDRLKAPDNALLDYVPKTLLRPANAHGGGVLRTTGGHQLTQPHIQNGQAMIAIVSVTTMPLTTPMRRVFGS